jgi:hypothetical protein
LAGGNVAIACDHAPASDEGVVVAGGVVPVAGGAVPVAGGDAPVGGVVVPLRAAQSLALAKVS